MSAAVRFLILLIGLCGAALGREYTQMLSISNAYTGGGAVWGPVELCPNDTFVYAAEALYNPPGHLDETALNALKLYCSTLAGLSAGYIASTQGNKGNWYGMQICSTDFVTGFRALVLEEQGIFTDDVAVEDMEVDCFYGQEIVPLIPIPVPMKKGATPYDFNQGVWSTFDVCRPGTAVCGIQIKFEDGSLGDEAAIADINLFCCDRAV